MSSKLTEHKDVKDWFDIWYDSGRFVDVGIQATNSKDIPYLGFQFQTVHALLPHSEEYNALIAVRKKYSLYNMIQLDAELIPSTLSECVEDLSKVYKNAAKMYDDERLEALASIGIFQDSYNHAQRRICSQTEFVGHGLHDLLFDLINDVKIYEKKRTITQDFLVDSKSKEYVDTLLEHVK